MDYRRFAIRTRFGTNFLGMKLRRPRAGRLDQNAVLAFYNERRAKASEAAPNAAHEAIASLEAAYDVVVITQNVDELHERAGSTKIVHLHGQLSYARGTSDRPKRYRIGSAPILLGQLCEDGTQLRPDIVWFGENVQRIEEARQHVASAAKVLVVGTSLSVYPAAALVKVARGRAEKVLNGLDIGKVPFGFSFLRGNATSIVPKLVEKWLGQAL